MVKWVERGNRNFCFIRRFRVLDLRFFFGFLDVYLSACLPPLVFFHSLLLWLCAGGVYFLIKIYRMGSRAGQDSRGVALE